VVVGRKRASAMTEPRSFGYTVQRCQDIVKMRTGKIVHRVRVLVLREALNLLLHPERCAAGFLRRERSTPDLYTGVQDAERRRNRIAISEI
jgi:hypothetical protein